jgi:heptosyltransferase-2
VVSGDSLACTLPSRTKKQVVAWFGLSCAAEIDLYDRGIKIIRDLPCAPCWKKVCDMPHGPICVTEFKPEWIVNAVREICDNLSSTRAEFAHQKSIYFELVR